MTNMTTKKIKGPCDQEEYLREDLRKKLFAAHYAKRAEAERVEAERVEAERVEAERVEAERVEAERVEAERVEAERVEAKRTTAADIIALICIEEQISKSKDDLYISSLLEELSHVADSLDKLEFQEEVDAIIKSMATFLSVTDEKKATEFLEDLSSSVVIFVMRRRNVDIRSSVSKLNCHYRLAEVSICRAFKIESSAMAYERECAKKNKEREAEENRNELLTRTPGRDKMTTQTKPKVNTMNTATKKELDLIYRHTHKDFKGTTDGVRYVLTYRNGTTRVRLEDLTDKEVASCLSSIDKKLQRAKNN